MTNHFVRKARDTVGTMEASSRGFVLSVLRFLAACGLLWLGATPCRACFSIVVGKDASAEGCVLVAHNEDDTAPQIVNHHKVPRRRHGPEEMVTLTRGGRLEQVPETWAYLWSEMPGMEFSDSYVNEWGVCVTSDNCPSREDRGELTEGGIGTMLRRLVAERARTAREGVRIAGDLVERFGYIASGRTYIIADPDEGWLFCAIQGKHWLARRVADDEVAMVANTFTVREVELSDKDNVLACEDIVSYAIERGWYDSEKDGPFDFAAVYANPRSASHPVNYGRQSVGLRYVAAASFAADARPPFSVPPSKKLGVADLIRILRHNGSGRSIRAVDGRQVVCDTAHAICRGSTQTSFVARLGTKPSRGLGIVYWVCLSAPATSVFVPFHFAVADFPSGYARKSERPSKLLFDSKVTSPFQAIPSQAFWTFSNFAAKAEAMPNDRRTSVQKAAEAIEARARKTLPTIQQTAYGLAKTDPAAAGRLLKEHSEKICNAAIEMMERSR